MQTVLVPLPFMPAMMSSSAPMTCSSPSTCGTVAMALKSSMTLSTHGSSRMYAGEAVMARTTRRSTPEAAML